MLLSSRDGAVSGGAAWLGSECAVRAAGAAWTILRPPGSCRTSALSGPRLLTFGAAVDAIAEATGRDIRYVPVSGAEYAAHADSPPELTEALTTLWGWIRDGRNTHLSDGVHRVLGREPRDFTAYVWRS